MNDDIWLSLETNTEEEKKRFDNMKNGFSRVINHIKKIPVCNLCGLTNEQHKENKNIRHSFICAMNMDKCVDCDLYFFQHTHKKDTCMYKPLRHQRNYIKKKMKENGIYEPNFIKNI